MRGTVRYMPLEQLAGGPPSAEIDVYAIGVMLYEMLTGVPPVAEMSPERKVHHLLSTSPMPPSSHDALISADIDRVVMKCLARDPENRYSSAAPLSRALQQLVAGEALDDQETQTPSYAPLRGIVVASPESDFHVEGAKHHRWSWTLACSPHVLWPLVANTDRLNKALGLPEVSFSSGSAAEEPGTFLRTGHATIFGPRPPSGTSGRSSGIRDREHSVLRRYSAGPIEMLMNRVRLTPLEGGGTELVHEIWARPRGAVGTVASLVEIDWKTRRNLDRLYRRLDAVRAGDEAATGGRLPKEDPFELPHAQFAAAVARAELAVETLLKAHSFAPTLVARLRDHVLYLPAKALEKLRPYAPRGPVGREPGGGARSLSSCGRRRPTVTRVGPRLPSLHDRARDGAVSLAEVTRAGACVSVQGAA